MRMQTFVQNSFVCSRLLCSRSSDSEKQRGDLGRERVESRPCELYDDAGGILFFFFPRERR